MSIVNAIIRTATVGDAYAIGELAKEFQGYLRALGKDAEDYWFKGSSGRFLHAIIVPSLIVNARDDPFLADGCYPIQQAERSKYVHLEMPRSGGHVGFVQFNRDGSYWSENHAVEFLGREW